jgi:hypothetical protein
VGQGGGLINLGELSRPATVLVKKISDAIGGIFRPHQIRRIAQAEAEAEKIRAVSQLEITALQDRAISRFFIEEAKKQYNIETITSKALPLLEDGASPQNIEDDWIAHFFDKCRLISDEDMQTLWSKVLAGEANRPGRYSKRTISLISSLDKGDAELFRRLCSFVWQIGDLVPLIYNDADEIYTASEVYFNSLIHLEETGLISFLPVTGYRRKGLPQRLAVLFYAKPFIIEFPRLENNNLPIGMVLLSQAGQQLAPICESAPCPGFQEYVVARWRNMGLRITEVS